jgi:hypothetical protein
MKFSIVILAALIGCSFGYTSDDWGVLTDAETAGVQSTLDSYFSLVKMDCKTWATNSFTANAVFFQDKVGVVSGVANLTNFCTTLQGLFKVQELRQDGPFTWVMGASDKSRLHILSPALYSNDSPYINSEYLFFEMVRVDTTTQNQDSTNNISYKIERASEMLSRSGVPFKYPVN